MKISFGQRNVEPDVRMLYDMKEVVYDKEWLKDAENIPLYYMFRDLWKAGDRQRIEKLGLRYDITIIPGRMLGQEYVKTKGHYHPVAGTVDYPEIYEVLEGEAHYLLQKRKAERTILVKAKQGNKVIIPPGYGHITINPQNCNLKMANWVCRNFESEYEPIVEKGGGAWFELEDGFKKNPNYGSVPDLEICAADGNNPFDRNLYDLINEPNKLDFLVSPDENKKIFEYLEFF